MGKSSPSAPPTPNYSAVAQQQGAANKEAIQESAKINALDTVTPYGSLTYEKDDGGLPTKRIETLSADGQQLLDTRNSISNDLADLASNKIGHLPTDKFTLDGTPSYQSSIDRSGFNAIPQSTDFTDHAKATSQAVYDKNYSLMQPELQRQEASNYQRLADRGIKAGNEEYDNQVNRFETNRGEQLNRLANDATFAGNQEQSRLYGQAMQGRQQQGSEAVGDMNMRNAGRSQGIQDDILGRTQNYNELSGFLQGAPMMGSPQFAPNAQYNVQAPNLMGAAQAQNNAAMNTYNQQNASNNAAMGGLYGLGGSAAAAAIPMMF